jgi:hypothetical protein
LPYEALEKHEAECVYQLQQCSGCQQHSTKKDFSEHNDQCPLISLTCADCKNVYQRRDAGTSHSDIICLKEQLQQVRSELQQVKLELKNSKFKSEL